MEPKEMVRLMRRNALLTLLAGAAILVWLTGSLSFGYGWNVGSTVLLVLALVLIATSGYVLTPTYAGRSVAKYAPLYERMKSGPTPDLMRASLRVAMKALVVSLVALVFEAPVAGYLWPNGDLQPWLVAMVGVTVLWALLMAAILIRDRRWR